MGLNQWVIQYDFRKYKIKIIFCSVTKQTFAILFGTFWKHAESFQEGHIITLRNSSARHWRWNKSKHVLIVRSGLVHKAYYFRSTGAVLIATFSGVPPKSWTIYCFRDWLENARPNSGFVKVKTKEAKPWPSATSMIGFVRLWAASNRPLRATWAKTAAPTWFAAEVRYGRWSALNEASLTLAI